MDRFLAIDPGAHILALELNDEAAALDSLRCAGVTSDEASITECDAGGEKARFAMLMPPDLPEERVLPLRHLTRDLLRRLDNTVHPNHAAVLTEAIYTVDAPAETMTRLSRLAGHPAEPDPLGGYRVALARGTVRTLACQVGASLFPAAIGTAPVIRLTIAREAGTDRVVHAYGVAIRFTAASH